MSFDNEIDNGFDFEFLVQHQEEEMQTKTFNHLMENYKYELKNARKRRCGGSILGRLGITECNYKEAHNRLIEDYFVNDSKYRKNGFIAVFEWISNLFLG